MIARIWIGLVMGFLLTHSGLAEEMTLETLKVGPQTYRKVIITSRSEDRFVIMHAAGMATIKVAELDPETRLLVGYQAKTEEPDPLAGTVLSNIPMNPEVVQAREKFVRQFGERIKGADKQIAAIALAIFAFIYLFTCYCCKLICEKTGYKPRLLVWIPGLQFLPLLKAAGMPGWWFIISLSPILTPFLIPALLSNMGPAFLWVALIPSVLSMIAYIIWSFKICQARGVSSWAGILLLLPVTNLLTFLYLAFGAASTKAASSSGGFSKETFSKSRAQDTSFFMNS